MAGEAHPVPCRTRKLSPRAPMVLRSESVGEQVAADQRGTFAGAAGHCPGAPAFFCGLAWSALQIPGYSINCVNWVLFGGSCGLTSRQIASQQCTQVPRNGPEGPFPPICVHSCMPTVVRTVAAVYTSAPKRRRGGVFANLCTLLRPRVCPQRCNSVHKCPKTAPRGHFHRSVYTPASPPRR